MPFVSEAQRAYMYKFLPRLAQEFERHTPKGKKLPRHVGKLQGERSPELPAKQANWRARALQALLAPARNRGVQTAVGGGVAVGGGLTAAAYPAAYLAGRGATRGAGDGARGEIAALAEEARAQADAATQAIGAGLNSNVASAIGLDPNQPLAGQVEGLSGRAGAAVGEGVRRELGDPFTQAVGAANTFLSSPGQVLPAGAGAGALLGLLLAPPRRREGPGGRDEPTTLADRTLGGLAGATRGAVTGLGAGAGAMAGGALHDSLGGRLLGAGVGLGAGNLLGRLLV
jgi:hypothetical protein